MNFTHKKICITGGNSGIGFATAKQFAKEDAEVTILGRDAAKVSKAAAEIGDNVSTCVADLSTKEGRAHATGCIENGQFDIVINNAGIIQYDTLQDHSFERVEEMVAVNLTAVIQLSRAALPYLLKQNKGSIVNISSTSGLHARANETVYVASKWGVRGFTEALQNEVKDTHLRIIGVYPGGTETNLFASASGEMPKGKGFMKPEDIADAIVYALKQPNRVKLDTLVVNRNTNVS